MQQVRNQERICHTCSKVFHTTSGEINRGFGLYCSRSCSSGRPRPPKPHNLICKTCEKSFYGKLHKKSKSGLRFCSRPCKNKATEISSGIPELWPKHFNDGESSYRERMQRHCIPKCEKCGYDTVPEILVVHHRNHNRSDNKLENLAWLCPNCHETHHFKTASGKWTKYRVRRETTPT